MSDGITTIIYPVTDLARAKAVFSEFLGVEPYLDQPYYVGYRNGDQEVGLDPHGHTKGMTGPVAYRKVPDVNTSVKGLVEAGAEVVQDAKDVGGGTLVAFLKDADGNFIGFIQPPAD